MHVLSLFPLAWDSPQPHLAPHRYERLGIADYHLNVDSAPYCLRPPGSGVPIYAGGYCSGEIGRSTTQRWFRIPHTRGRRQEPGTRPDQLRLAPVPLGPSSGSRAAYPSDRLAYRYYHDCLRNSFQPLSSPTSLFSCRPATTQQPMSHTTLPSTQKRAKPTIR